PVPGPAGTEREASGRAAKNSTAPRRAVVDAHARSDTGRAISSERAPEIAVAAPESIKSGNSGTQTRFAGSDTSEIRPNAPATIGIVGSVAASVVAMPSRNTPGRNASLS